MVDQNGRPDQGFQKAEDARAKRGGLLDKIDQRADERQTKYSDSTAVFIHALSIAYCGFCKANFTFFC